MRSAWKILIFSACLLSAFLAGSWFAGEPAGKTASGERRILYYMCPMHPEFRSDKPGDAPCCGMRLEPVYEGGDTERSTSVPPGSVKISQEKQQMIGIRVDGIRRSPIDPVIRTIGRVSADETRIYRVTAATDGWIEEAKPNSVGSIVQQNQVLATYYSREFLGAQQSLFYALDARDRHLKQSSNEAQMSSTNVQIQSSIDNLRAMGMTRAQIDQLAEKRERAFKIEIRAPATGFVLVRNVSPGQRFKSGDEFYRIVDLSKVWVLADLFEREAADIHAGQSAAVQYQGRIYRAKISEVLPIFDENTRTMKVRLELDNHGYPLRPGMFVDVEIAMGSRESMTVPAEAVTNTGLRSLVFVAKENGYFEPRAVKTGRRFHDRVEIVDGLDESEKIAVSGTFLIDSEARMKPEASKESGMKAHESAATDPVCGMEVFSGGPEVLKSIYEGKTYYFCNSSCKKKFDKDPMQYLKN